MKKCLTLILSLMLAAGLYAQNETLKEGGGCPMEEIMEYVDDGKVYEKVFSDPYDPDEESAVSSAWAAFNTAFGTESLPHGVISTVFEPDALQQIDGIMGNIGNSLALIQIATDLSNGDKLKTMENSVKTGMFYAIGKWGWRSLKLAGTGLQVFDYMLTSFGQFALTSKLEGLAEAYKHYYNSPKGKRDLETWRKIIERAESDEALQKEIDDYLNAYFVAEDYDRLITYKKYEKEQKDAVKQDFLQYNLLPYLQPLFKTLEKEAREEKIREVCNEYEKVIRLLNTRNRYRIRLDAPPDSYGACKAAIQVMRADGTSKLYVKGSFNDEGICYLSFTKYSLLVNDIEKARAVLRYSGPGGVKMFYRDIDLREDRTTVDFSLSEEEEKPEAQTKDIAEAERAEAPETPEKPEGAIELGGTLKAVLTTNAVPLNVKIKEVRNNDREYAGNIVHGRFPRKNTLTINKLTREMTLVYKLRGPFAPELICRGLPVAPNTYTGIIETNNAEKVKVGTFTLVLTGK